jgi:SpoVK/Ycf46/Vps4 family AAA+-type ATPase
VLAATNHPSDIDEAIRRRFVKRLYVRLPDLNTRIDIFKKIIKPLLHKKVPNKQ